MSKGILVTGATGKQGGATIDALLSSPTVSSDFTILALTRSPDSASAKKLLSRSENIKIVAGDLNNVPAVFETAKALHPNIWGVFSVQVPVMKFFGPHSTEESDQGKALVDSALTHGVRQFVYVSVDRHGDESINNPTEVPHFITKHEIEKHLIERTKGTDMSYSIFRCVAFMENFTPDALGRGFAAMYKVGIPEDKPLQLISTADIGHFAAEAFRKPSAYRNRVMSLAGDQLTYKQMNEVFREKTGTEAPRSWDITGNAMLWGIKELGTMFKFFDKPGFDADVAACRAEHPGMLTLGQWIETKSAFAKK